MNAASKSQVRFVDGTEAAKSLMNEVDRLRAVNADLLAALEGMLGQFGNQRFAVRKDYSKMVHVEAARTAIAKARGEG